jgi:membrane associated rhomboid family serine protease
MIPVSTDAPIYHYPIGTVGLIAANLGCFLLFCNLPSIDALDSPEAFEESFYWIETLALEFGAFKPWQWFTCNFLHSDWIHLIGNMIFLWSFGMIVEGKIGLLRFLAIYAAIGTVFGMVAQLISIVFAWEGISLGASGVIFGLLAFCIAWAPANEFEVLWLLGRAGGTLEISILVFGVLFVAKEALFFSLGGFQVSSELFHIVGFLVALPFALWMVKAAYVDCEGWDIFSYLSGATGANSRVAQNRLAMETARERAAMARQSNANRIATQEALQRSLPPEKRAGHFREQVRSAIDSGSFELAAKLQEKITLSNPGITWNQEDLYATIHGLLKERKYSVVAPLMSLHIDSFEEHRSSMQKLLIKMWLKEQRPRHALRFMRGMDRTQLTPKELDEIRQLANHAQKLIDDGVVEFSN